MHLVDAHTRACSLARLSTILSFGTHSVPCTPGTEAHRHWLDIYTKELGIASTT